MKENFTADYWHHLDSKTVECELCPHRCQILSEQKGFCQGRGNIDGQMVLYNYGNISGFSVDPIEKKPLNHFHPGSSILSFGTWGCNLSCQFCQNWDISSRQNTGNNILDVPPERVIEMAQEKGLSQIAFTYNEPIISLEYVRDVALLAKAEGMQSVAVTAGYINAGAREEFFSFFDAANIDLKAFSNKFYSKLCGIELEAILDTIQYVKQETNVWLELTNLIIPGFNDDEQKIRHMCEWIVENLGEDVPLHFSGFHPAYQMKNVPATSLEMLKMAKKIAREVGMNYIYLGNVSSKHGGDTYCPSCGKLLIERDWYRLEAYYLDKDGHCSFCNHKIAGRF